MQGTNEPPASPATNLEDAVLTVLENPQDRQRALAAFRSLGGSGTTARRIKAAILIGGAALVAAFGAPTLDGATLTVAGVLGAAGVAELSGQ